MTDFWTAIVLGIMLLLSLGMLVHQVSKETDKD